MSLNFGYMFACRCSFTRTVKTLLHFYLYFILKKWYNSHHKVTAITLSPKLCNAQIQ